MSFNVHRYIPTIPPIQHVAPILSRRPSALPPGVSEEEHIKAQNEILTNINNFIGAVGEPTQFAEKALKYLSLIHI